MELTWAVLHHRDLTPSQLYEILRLRQDVFVIEQECPYDDIDGRDLAGENHHLLGTDADGTLIAYARLLAPGDGHPTCHPGRIVVSPAGRGRQLGRELVRVAIDACARLWPEAPIEIEAQAHLERFYGSLGFVSTSAAPFDVDGIPHLDMTLVRP